MAKVQNEMATKISLDTITATDSLKGLTSAVSAATSSFKANSAMLASAGDMVGSYSEKVNGLSNAMELQQSKIDALRSRQEGLDVTTQSGAEQYQKLEKQIATATRQMASMESQQERAKNSLGYYTSGLADLQRGYETAQKASQAYVSRLEAEGKQDEANQARMSGLKQSLSNLSSQYEKQEEELRKIASTSGTTSEAYLNQKTRLDETGTAVAETNSKISKLNSEMKTAPTGFFAKLKSGFSKTGEEAEKAGKKVHIGLGVFIGNALTNGIAQATSAFKEFATQGFESAEAAQEVAEKWKNMGASKADINAMGASVKSLKENTNLSGTAVANLTTKFYDMTGSASKTNELAQGVGSLSDKLKLTSTQADGFANGLSRIEASGEITSSSLGRIEKQAPGLGTALQQASGMSKTAFDSLVSSGKMTSDQFNDILQKASSDYKKNSSEFDSSSQGALKHLQQSWADTKQALMTPLVNVAATGLSSLSKVLEAPAMQNAIKQLGAGIAELSTKLAGILTYVSEHQKDIGGITGSLTTITKLLFDGAWKAVSGTINGIANAFSYLFGKSKESNNPLKNLNRILGEIAKHKKAVEDVGAALIGAFAAVKLISGIATLVKGIGTVIGAFRTMAAFVIANPFVAIAAAVVAIGFALFELYKHSKPFRDFVNGIARAAKNAFDGMVKAVSGALKTIGKFFTGKLGWEKAIGNEVGRVNKAISSGFRAIGRFIESIWNNVAHFTSSVWNGIWRSISNFVSNIWHDVIRGFKRIGSNIVGIWDNIKKWTSGAWDAIFEFVSKPVDAVWNKVTSVFGKLSSWIGDTLGGIKNAWHDVWSDVASFFGSIWDGVKNAGKDGINGVIDFLNGGINGIDSVIHFFGGKKKTISDIPRLAVGTMNGRLAEETLAVLNDGHDSPETGNKEMIIKSNGRAGIVQGTNVLTHLDAGDAVVNAHDTKSIMYGMGIPHFANGSGWFGDIKSAISWVGGKFDDVGKWIGDKTKAITRFFKNPVGEVTKVFDKFTSGFTNLSKFVGDFAKPAGHYIIKQGESWFKKLFDKLNDDLSAPAGAGVERWRGQVKKALKANGLSTSESMVNKVLRQISTESGGNPNARQLGSDPDGDGSGPALGLMQTKQGTFNAYKFAGHGSIFNGYDNLLAALKYAKARYGSSLYFLGNGHGYANGGVVSTEGLYTLAEGNQPEFVIPTDYTKHNRAVELLNQAKTAITGTGLDNGTSKKLDTLIEQNSALISLVKAMLTKKMDVNFNGKLVGELYPEFDKQGYVSNSYQQRNVWG